MLPVNFAHEDYTTASPFSIAVKRYAIASTLDKSTGAENAAYSSTGLENEKLPIPHYSKSKQSKQLCAQMHQNTRICLLIEHI